MHQVDAMQTHTHTHLCERAEAQGKDSDTTKRYKHRITCKEPASLTCSSPARTASQQNLDQAQSRAGQISFSDRYSFPPNQYFLAG